MTQKEAVVKALYSQVFGGGDPTGHLVDDGKLPEGWAAEYVRLAEIARSEWGKDRMWPRDLVAAIHFASFYLPLRYDVWRSGTSRRNEQTERELSGIRTPGEIFLLSWQSAGE